MCQFIFSFTATHKFSYLFFILVELLSFQLKLFQRIQSKYQKTRRLEQQNMLFCFIFELNLKAIYIELFTYEKKKKKQTLWPLLKDGFQLPQGQCHFKEAVYFLPLSCQICLVLRPRKDERLSRPWKHPADLNIGHLDWKSNASGVQKRCSGLH